jgi:NAD(P)-dependent dehydrogenase (short-subunit alcohol dehydrogenase family)
MPAGTCTGRVAVITGAGNGIGRAHALAFAAQGAKVVVNDLGGARDGRGSSAGGSGPARAVVDEITAAGGEAVASTDDISSWAGAARLIEAAVEAFGGLDVVVNNAGILRDRMIVSMTEADWDAVIGVHLKGTFAVLHHAAAYWRQRVKDGHANDARVINTTSPSGLFGNAGQANYGAAKAGIASLTIIAARALRRHGQRHRADRADEDDAGHRDDAHRGGHLRPEPGSHFAAGGLARLGRIPRRNRARLRRLGQRDHRPRRLGERPGLLRRYPLGPARPVRGRPRPGRHGRSQRRHHGPPQAGLIITAYTDAWAGVWAGTRNSSLKVPLVTRSRTSSLTSANSPRSVSWVCP